MDVILKKTSKNCRIVVGFPGFGLVGTITTEYLVNHLEVEEVGYIDFREGQPLVAVHDEHLMRPITLYYAKKQNLLIVHAITPPAKEWDIAEALHDIKKKTQAKELISLEGVSSKKKETNIFCLGAKITGIKPLQNGMIAGVTAALMSMRVPVTALFAQVHSRLPDSRAAAEMIKVLDKHLGLDLDPAPLMKQAEMFEEKLKGLMESREELQQQQPRYIG